MPLSTAILSETYRISSELRSQATAGPVSTTVGDHVGIRGAVGSCPFSLLVMLWLSFLVSLLLCVFLSTSPSPSLVSVCSLLSVFSLSACPALQIPAHPSSPCLIIKLFYCITHAAQHLHESLHHTAPLLEDARLITAKVLQLEWNFHSHGSILRK